LPTDQLGFGCTDYVGAIYYVDIDPITGLQKTADSSRRRSGTGRRDRIAENYRRAKQHGFSVGEDKRSRRGEWWPKPRFISIPVDGQKAARCGGGRTRTALYWHFEDNQQQPLAARRSRPLVPGDTKQLRAIRGGIQLSSERRECALGGMDRWPVRERESGCRAH